MLLRKLLLAFLLLLPGVAMAQEKPAACATIAECQKKIDDQAGQIAKLSAGLEGARQQRDAARTALDDLALQQHIEQATAKK